MKKTKFIAFARVSTAEQKKEGWSLQVQEDALRQYAAKKGGSVVELFTVAETASKEKSRSVFREMLDYARKHADEVDGVLFYSVDRAARNLHDLGALEELRLQYGVPSHFVTQSITADTAGGEMMIGIYGSVARYEVRQMIEKVVEAMTKRAKSGLFISRLPYGYLNVEKDGRDVVEAHPENGSKVQHIFHLYAYENHTLDSLRRALAEEGIAYTAHTKKFPRSVLYRILTNRAYLGEVSFRGEWFPGTHEPLVDTATWKRVQALLGGKVYQAHALVYSGGLIECGYCGHKITGERKVKKTKHGEREYVYYRCAQYNSEGHPRDRAPESKLDEQILGEFRKMQIADEELRDWFSEVLQAATNEEMEASKRRLAELQRQQSRIASEKDRLVDMRMKDEIDADTFARKQTQLRDRAADIRLRIEACERGRDEHADMALKAFELSQHLVERWLGADYAEKRIILDIVFLNLTLNGVSLETTKRKAFRVLSEAPVLVDGVPTGI